MAGLVDHAVGGEAVPGDSATSNEEHVCEGLAFRWHLAQCFVLHAEHAAQELQKEPPTVPRQVAIEQRCVQETRDSNVVGVSWTAPWQQRRPGGVDQEPVHVLPPPAIVGTKLTSPSTVRRILCRTMDFGRCVYGGGRHARL